MKTYFFMSDIHGVHPKEVLEALYNKGYDITNPNHYAVVAGDFTDGLTYDNELVEFFKGVQKHSNLIAVRGNHDADAYLKGLVDSGQLKTENARWLESLPWQINHEHFYLAHGIYGFDRNISMWFSPVLLGADRTKWWNLTTEEKDSINKRYPAPDGLKIYLNEYKDKKMFIGHFDRGVIDQYVQYCEDLIVPLIEDAAFRSLRNQIVFLDNGTRHSGKPNVLKLTEEDLCQK